MAVCYVKMHKEKHPNKVLDGIFCGQNHLRYESFATVSVSENVHGAKEVCDTYVIGEEQSLMLYRKTRNFWNKRKN